MSTFIDEKTVMRFYIDCIDNDSIEFLKGRDAMKSAIRGFTEKLMEAETMNAKITIAVSLWKKLFEAAMSFISSDKRGYDKLFKYFDAYVEFEELIFASDSFYRDHTLHCIWVYFLGEYVARKPEYDRLFVDMRAQEKLMQAVDILGISKNKASQLKAMFSEYQRYQDASRCISALTHDLGYPLKKIEKINKSINKVLPFFSVNEITDFSFGFGSLQEGFVDSFIDFISRTFSVRYASTDTFDKSEDQENAMKRVQELVNRAFELEGPGENSQIVKLSNDRAAFTEEELKFIQQMLELKTAFELKVDYQNAFYNDFESYQHGIMSAYLLAKNLSVFQELDYDRRSGELNLAYSRGVARQLVMQEILTSISAHTCDARRISSIDREEYLTFIDELEEFSRISRASQNREYVKEFCESAIDMSEDGWLDIRFVFSNSNLDNLDPEISFKGRCKRFLRLFNIGDLSENLKLRVTCVGDLPTNHNTYELEIARNHADIRINGESQDIPRYLRSSEYFTKEEYETL